MPEISIIVAAHDAAKTVGKCLDALLGQSFERDRYEIILVDNGSSDDTFDIASKRDRVIVLSEPNKGAYLARNTGLAAARGRLIAFTDADCLAAPDWLEQLTSALSSEDTMVVMGRDRPAGTTTAIRLLSGYDHAKEEFVMSHADPAVYYGHTNNLMTRREVLDELGGFEARPRGADVIFVQRVIARYGTAAVLYNGNALVHHTELQSAADYFRKAFIYGRSLRSYSRTVQVRALSGRERWHVFRQVVESHHLSLPQVVYFLWLLVLGVWVYGVGWLLGSTAESRSQTPLPNPRRSDHER